VPQSEKGVPAVFLVACSASIGPAGYSRTWCLAAYMLVCIRGEELPGQGFDCCVITCFFSGVCAAWQHHQEWLSLQGAGCQPYPAG
jgi:hypothetical protein